MRGAGVGHQETDITASSVNRPVITCTAQHMSMVISKGQKLDYREVLPQNV